MSHPKSIMAYEFFDYLKSLRTKILRYYDADTVNNPDILAFLSNSVFEMNYTFLGVSIRQEDITLEQFCHNLFKAYQARVNNYQGYYTEKPYYGIIDNIKLMQDIKTLQTTSQKMFWQFLETSTKFLTTIRTENLLT